MGLFNGSAGLDVAGTPPACYLLLKLKAAEVMIVHRLEDLVPPPTSVLLLGKGDGTNHRSSANKTLEGMKQAACWHQVLVLGLRWKQRSNPSCRTQLEDKTRMVQKRQKLTSNSCMFLWFQRLKFVAQFYGFQKTFNGLRG